MSASSSGRFGSLSTSLVMATLAALVVVITAVSTAALIGTYGLARDQVGERQRTYVSVISSDLEVRLSGASGVVERASASVEETGPIGVDRMAFEAAYQAGIRRVDALIVVRDARPVVALTSSGIPDAATDSEFLARVAQEESTYFDVVRTDDDNFEIWAIHHAGPGAFVMGRVRYDLIEETILRAGSDELERVALVYDGEHGVVMGGERGPSLRLETVEFDVAGASEGSARFRTVDGVDMEGRYSRFIMNRGIDWMILVGEPSAGMLHTALEALVPTALALVLGGIISVIIAILLAGHVVRPLTDLEARANEGAIGAYVRPIKMDRADEIGRLADAFNMIALRLNALHDLSHLLASSSRLDQVLDGILSAMSHIMDSGNVAVYLYDKTEGMLIPVRARGLLERTAEPVDVAEGGWLVGAARSRDCAFWVGKASELPVFAEIDPDTNLSCLAAPLVLGEKSLGVIVVVRSGRREHTQAEIEMVRTFSAQAAVAVHNSHLFAEESRSRREAELMREVVERLAQPGDLARALESVSRLACELLDVSGCLLALLDPEQFDLPNVVRPEQRALAALWTQQASSEGDASFVMFENAHADALLEWAGAERMELIPVVRSGDHAGVLAFFLDDAAAQLSARDRKLAVAVGQQVSLALENAYHYQQARTRASDLETVFRISQAVSSSLRVKVVLNRVLDVVQKIFSAETVVLMTYDEGRRRLSTAMARGAVSSSLLRYEGPISDDLLGMVFESREPIRIDELAALDDPVAKDASVHGLASVLVVPLLARGRSIGALSVFSSVPANFSNQDMELLHTFAAQAALALDTASVYSREHKVATVLQGSILPQDVPDYPEIEVEALYRPLGGDAEIGGDYYDVFRAPDGRIVAVVADVCGKGVVAATKTSMIKYTLRALVAAGFGPARCLAETNALIAAGGDATDIVTTWIGFLDVRAGDLLYADGGHPPALILRAEDRQIVRTEVTGALMGAAADAEYEERHVRIGAGDTVLLYTDGVTEARDGNKFFGEGRVRRALRYGGSAADVLQRLDAALNRFVHGDLRDDAAVLVLKVRDVHDDRME